MMQKAKLDPFFSAIIFLKTIPLFTTLLLLCTSCHGHSSKSYKIEVTSSSWLEQLQKHQVPEWFKNANRVHGHTRLSALSLKKHLYDNNPNTPRKWLGTPIFKEAPIHFKAMGFEIFTRHIVSGNEPAWWVSSVGTSLPEAINLNIAKEIIDKAHAEGLKIIVYYRHMEDADMANKHPEWICLDSKGKPYKRRGLMMSFNTPYRDFVEKRLLELTDMGADGFYFDEIHQPDICNTLTTKNDTKNREQIIRDMFLHYMNVIHERNPEVVLLVSARFEGLSHDLWRLPDICKIEPHLVRKYGGSGSLGYALGLTFIRDAADGKPAHLWWSPKKESTLADSAWTLSFGHIFNFDVWETSIANSKSKSYRKALKHTKFGSTLTPYMRNMVPLKEVLIHYPEGIPDGLKKKPTVLPSFKKILAAHIPTGIIINSQLREGIPNESKVLVIPDPLKAPLNDPRVSQNIASFKKRGGRLILGLIEKEEQKEVQILRTETQLYATGSPNDFLLTAYRTKNNDRWTVILLNPTDKKIQAKVTFTLARKPLKIIDIMKNKELLITPNQSGFSVDLPPFQPISALSVYWDKTTTVP